MGLISLISRFYEVITVYVVFEVKYELAIAHLSYLVVSLDFGTTLYTKNGDLVYNY